MMMWKYKVVESATENYLEEELNEYGKDGWELVAFKWVAPKGVYRLVLKRQIFI